MDTLLEVIADVLGTPVGDLTKKIKSGEDFLSKSEIQKAIKVPIIDKLEAAKRDAKDEGYSRAKREVLSDIEKKLAEKYDVEKTNIDDLVAAIAAKQKEKSKLDPNDVRNHEVYQQDIKKLKDKLELAETNLAKTEKEYKAKEVRSEASKFIENYLQENKYILPEDKEAKEFQLQILVEKALSPNGGFLDIVDGKLQLFKEDGKPLMNDVGNVIKFEDHIQTLAPKLFKVAQSDGRKSPGNQEDPPGSKKFNFEIIKDPEAYFAKLHTIKDLEEKQEFIKAHKEHIQ